MPDEYDEQETELVLDDQGPSQESPYVDDEPGQEAEQDDPWAWTEGIDPTEVRETFENTRDMQRRAHERNEESARNLADAQRRFEEAEQMRREAFSAPRYAPPRQDEDEDDWSDVSGRGGNREIERRLAEIEQRHQQQINEMRFRTESTRAETVIRDVLRTDPKLRPVVELYGEDKAAEMYVQKAFNDPNIRPGDIRNRAREWASDDATQIGAYRSQLLRDAVRTKARARTEAPSTPAGPRRPVRASPNRGARKIDWRKDVPQEVELDELAKAFSDVERENGER
jgi:hypothetical protein